VNVLAVPAAPGQTPLPPLTWWAVASRTWKSEHVLDFLRYALPPGKGLPRVVVLDNASTHRSQMIRDARKELAELGIELRYLPSYSPELNDIERTFRRAKHEAMPRRTQPHARALLAAVHACFGDLRDELEDLHLSMRNA
jgi:transposase